MEESYLDISKSVMISSPAGSGKTEKLARRYIALLKNGSDVERILAITFTEKAAAEMKERVLKILEREDPDMFDRVREKMPAMRISTIHAFCLKLLKRFCLELDMDPSLEVMDSFNADMLWSEAVYESLLEDGASGERLFYDVIKGGGVKGWTKLHNMLNELHSKRPNIEFGFSKKDMSTGSDQAPGRFQDILSVYLRCLERYRRKKKERHSLDYNDLELLAYESITMNPEWQNVLFAFDEHTDHLLVDEFQDTSSLQWRIIDKLTEEWRAGLGSKREKGIRPTIFLVGDDKQSIYSFRGANVSIFRNAKERLNDWLGDEYHFMEAKENYRSLPAIVDFVNALFGKLMPRGLYDHWKVEYAPFEATREATKEGRGGVELCLLEGIGDTKENRKAEASVMAKKIKALARKYEINRREGKKACSYEDMAILLRNRTHLSIFEDALRKEGVPFVVVKGIGFYNTPEIGTMKCLLFVLIDPLDDYSLFNVLRSPLFSCAYGSLLEVLSKTPGDTVAAGSLYDGLNSMCQRENAPLPSQKGLWEASDTRLQGAMSSINRWLLRVKEVPFAVLLEEALEETGAWQYFHERDM